MTQWIKPDTGEIIDTAMGQGITIAGTYYLNRARLDPMRPFAFSASTKATTHTATIQLFAAGSGATLNLGSPIVPVFGTPVLAADEYTLTGDRGIVVSGLTGEVFPEANQ